MAFASHTGACEKTEAARWLGMPHRGKFSQAYSFQCSGIYGCTVYRSNTGSLNSSPACEISWKSHLQLATIRMIVLLHSIANENKFH